MDASEQRVLKRNFGCLFEDRLKREERQKQGVQVEGCYTAQVRDASSLDRGSSNESIICSQNNSTS